MIRYNSNLDLSEFDEGKYKNTHKYEPLLCNEDKYKSVYKCKLLLLALYNIRINSSHLCSNVSASGCIYLLCDQLINVIELLCLSPQRNIE